MNTNNNYMLNTIIDLTECPEDSLLICHEVLKYMDEEGCHPDWSESTDEELIAHFSEVWNEMCEYGYVSAELSELLRKTSWTTRLDEQRKLKLL